MLRRVLSSHIVAALTLCVVVLAMMVGTLNALSAQAIISVLTLLQVINANHAVAENARAAQTTTSQLDATKQLVTEVHNNTNGNYNKLTDALISMAAEAQRINAGRRKPQ